MRLSKNYSKQDAPQVTVKPGVFIFYIVYTSGIADIARFSAACIVQYKSVGTVLSLVNVSARSHGLPRPQAWHVQMA